MREIVYIDNNNSFLLEKFIKNIGEAGKTFRYFHTRKADIIQKHLATVIITEGSEPVAYGHLEREGDETWLGICVIPGYYGKGYGNLMMKTLVQKAKELTVKEISLTVDKVNEIAIKLYERLGFERVKAMEMYYKYRLALT